MSQYNMENNKIFYRNDPEVINNASTLTEQEFIQKYSFVPLKTLKEVHSLYNKNKKSTQLFNESVSFHKELISDLHKEEPLTKTLLTGSLSLIGDDSKLRPNLAFDNEIEKPKRKYTKKL